MRISTIQAFNNGVQGLQRNYANVTRTQEQISTGNRILTPADDPVASVRLLQLEQQQSVLAQHKDNLTAANNSLTQEEVTLNSVNTILQRVRELAVQAGNGALSQSDRQSIAAELGAREEELFGLMNTRNARGEYLFAGFQGKTQPFVRQGDGSYSYQGDEGQRKLQVASSLDLAISDSGKKIFQNVTNAGRLDAALDASLAPGSTLSVSPPLVQDEVVFAGNPAFPGTGIEIRFDPTDPKRYDIYDIPAGAVLASGRMDADDVTSDQLVFRGVSVQFDGVPVGGESIQITADPSRQKQGILDTISQLRTSLENPATGLQVRDAVAVALTNLDHGMSTVDSVRGEIGARLNIIDSTQTDNEDVALVNKSVQADLRELDYAEALSRLSFQTIVLEASQQSYIKIAGLSLFNKLG
ncbi:flagellar hook protein FlgL [Pseudomonas taeanensis MS-3]|jgi:flagellar hook-associated protein 3 FlgL|uniref:Flagellar hook protein FlgL n=1 Tax=Pseudomonas taeanensis MS-3 TaxID=1395571 RepID=A0A0A1YJT7_9PSED|nr:flagellar hook-associated protein FlgL [Pseudomonas taeanensis]KFX70170.1 flagellar hook protein FlgL [Pseudomonas taeanensis MS-3]